MALTTIDSVTVDQAGGGARTIYLCSGDITEMSSSDAVDFIAISALPGDYSPSQGSVIGALAQEGVSVQAEANNKAADYEPTMPCWVSQDVSSAGLNFSRFILFEPTNPSTSAAVDVPMIYQALECFTQQGATSIALPMVSTGSGGADFTIILRQLFFMGAHAAALDSWPLDTIRLIVYKQADIPIATTAFAAMKTAYENPPLSVAAYSPRPSAPATLPAGMTQRQYNCVQAYTGSAYGSINKALRANDLANSGYQHWEATIEGISSGLAELPDYTGLTKRGTDLPPAVIADYKVGATITHISFTSSSRDQPWHGNSLLNITSVEGKDVENISRYPQEHEVLYDYGMTDQVTKVQGASGGYQHVFTSTQVVPNWCGSQASALELDGSDVANGYDDDSTDAPKAETPKGGPMPLPDVGRDAIDEVLRWNPAEDISADGAAEVAGASAVYEATQLENQLAAMEFTGFAAPFDWQSEFSDRREDLESREAVASANLELLRKIMTAHMRIDRFDDGHLERLVASGYWTNCLERLRDLRSTL